MNIESVYFLLNELLETLGRHGLWSLQGETHGAGPDHLGEATQSAGNTEQNSVVVHLGHTVVLNLELKLAIFVLYDVIMTSLLLTFEHYDVIIAPFRSFMTS